ncbi:unnamed protein product [Amoebophrya sp. A120]|nr:unnamed protein product [Amoebophrya sp. A120]|eukprot:GSA120T00012107001.1
MEAALSALTSTGATSSSSSSVSRKIDVQKSRNAAAHPRNSTHGPAALLRKSWEVRGLQERARRYNFRSTFSPAKRIARLFGTILAPRTAKQAQTQLEPVSAPASIARKTRNRRKRRVRKKIMSDTSNRRIIRSLTAAATFCIFTILNTTHPTLAGDYDVSAWTNWPALAGLRCEEMVDFYPVGAEGMDWHDDIGRDAVRLCAHVEECAGIMQYVGEQETGTFFWKGRPQFCKAGDGEGNKFPIVKKNHDWVTIYKPEYLFRGCPEKYPTCKIGADPWLLGGGEQELAAATGAERKAASAAAPGPSSTQLDPTANYDYVFTSSLDMPFFAKKGKYIHLDMREFTGKGLGASEAKAGFMSVFFDHYDAVCPGGIDIHMAIEEMGLDDVYIDDGTPKERKKAFGPYQFTFFCGNFHNETSYPPQALVDTFVLGSLPLVPYELYRDLAKFHFHLPDAGQGVRRLRLKSAEDYLSDLAGNPKKEELMAYKQTFLLVMQNLLAYRYRITAPERIANGMCQLCKIKENDKDGDNIKYGFAIMSRRNQKEVRAGVRRTWASWIRRSGHFFEKWTSLKMSQVDYRFFVGHRGPDNPNDIDDEPDVEEVGVVESYRTINVKALSMVARANELWPKLTFLLRCDDDIYLRVFPLLYHLERRTPVMYWWGNFDHGSNVVRNETHPHYNTFTQLPEQAHPMWGDVFPLYARGSLWIMSSDLLEKVVEAFREEENAYKKGGDANLAELARTIPHPDDPMMGIFVENLVDRGTNINVDDRDWNLFSLNPSCDAKFSMLHERTWIIHHVNAETMDCFFDIDMKNFTAFPTPFPLQRDLPSLCTCAMNVTEEDNGDWDELEDLAPGQDHWYPRKRFNPELEFVDERDQEEDVATLDAPSSRSSAGKSTSSSGSSTEEGRARTDSDSPTAASEEDQESSDGAPSAAESSAGSEGAVEEPVATEDAIGVGEPTLVEEM